MLSTRLVEKNKMPNSDYRMLLCVCVCVLEGKRGNPCAYLLGGTLTVSGGDARPWWQWGCWAERSRVGMESQTREGGNSSVLVLLHSWKAFVLVLFWFCLLRNILIMFERSETLLSVSEFFPKGLG